VNDVPATEGSIDEISWDLETAAADCLDVLREEGLLVAVRDVQEGGAGIAILKMVGSLLDGKPGLDLILPGPIEFFGEGGPRYIVAVARQHVLRAEEVASEYSMSISAVAELRFDSTNLVRSYFGNVAASDFADIFHSSQPIGNI
jgi:phosphoribosylformylglycinamidine (FGAM) synthase-like enzyme